MRDIDVDVDGDGDVDVDGNDDAADVVIESLFSSRFVKECDRRKKAMCGTCSGSNRRA